MEDAEKELLKTERRELCRLHALRLSEIDKRLTRIDQALYGNGKPEEGILWISHKNNAILSWTTKISYGILAIVFSSAILKLLPEIFHLLGNHK